MVLTQIESLVAAGDYLAAVDLASHLADGTRDPEIELQLPVWRNRAFAQTVGFARAPWPPVIADPFPPGSTLPELRPRDFSLETIAGSILHHGGAVARDLLSPAEAAELRAGVDRALAACNAFEAGEPGAELGPWYQPFPLPPDAAIDGNARAFVRMANSLWAADSPRMLAMIVDLCERKGLISIVADYFGERPALSVGKTTLRRVPRTIELTGWHQDGAFLGSGVRSVNVWIALSDCGREAAGIDLLPARLPYIVETGGHGSNFAWAASEQAVAAEARTRGTEIQSPEFKAGDGLFFDHFLLHRTALPKVPLHDRWALELWFFAPSTYPLDQVPLTV